MQWLERRDAWDQNGASPGLRTERRCGFLFETANASRNGSGRARKPASSISVIGPPCARDHPGDGLFVLLPFDFTVDDLDAYADAVTTSVAGAVADSGIPHVVMLSSGGADLPDGTGPIAGMHRMEQALRATGPC